MTPSELLAVLPNIRPLPAELPLLAAGADADAEAAVAFAKEHPPSWADLIAAAARCGPAYGHFTRLQLAVVGPFCRVYLLVAMAGVAGTVASGLYSVTAGTTSPFGPANIAAGCVALALIPLHSITVWWLAAWPLSPAEALGLPLVLLWRWQTIVGIAGVDSEAPDAGPLSMFARHVEGDEYCPCARQSCAGDLGRQYLAWTAVDSVLRSSLIFVFTTLLPYWATFVSTGALTWTRWWGVLLGLVTFAGGLLNFVTFWSLAVAMYKTPVVQLSTRLQCRALSIKIVALLDSYRVLIRPRTEAAVVDGADQPGSKPFAADSDPFPVLRHIARTNLRINKSTDVRTVTSALLLFILGAVINLAVGCLPMWVLALGVAMVYILAQIGANHAAYNARIDAFNTLLRAGQSAALELLSSSSAVDAAEVAAGNGALDAAAAASLHRRQLVRSALQHDVERMALLSSSSRHATFLGLTFTYGSLRGLAITAITVAFATLGVLRGFGVRVVAESFCYA